MEREEEEEEENYSTSLPGVNYTGLDYPLDYNQQHQFMTARIGESSGENNVEMVDYMFNNPPPQQLSSSFCTSTSVDRMSFADVMQFAEFGPKSALNQAKISDEENGIDPVYFLKFPVLNDKYQDEGFTVGPQMRHEEKFDGVGLVQEEDEEEARVSEKTAARLRLLGETLQKNTNSEVKNRRKRPRSMKTSEEVESQRMTHIAVERNRRKQMNEHLRVLRSLMPGSYVQRGDQASIIGGAIEFVRELEQLLQCLESQKRRKLYGGSSDIVSRPLSESPSQAISQPQPPVFPPFLLPNDQIKLVDLETDLREETAENKSCLADVEVRLLGFDAMIKILSRRRPGQLLKTIAALEDLQLNILHTNITTIDQTVLYSFNVKMASDSRFTAEDIVSSVQQIYSFIHAGNTISSA